MVVRGAEFHFADRLFVLAQFTTMFRLLLFSSSSTTHHLLKSNFEIEEIEVARCRAVSAREAAMPDCAGEMVEFLNALEYAENSHVERGFALPT